MFARGLSIGRRRGESLRCSLLGWPLAGRVLKVLTRRRGLPSESWCQGAKVITTKVITLAEDDHVTAMITFAPA
jgi:hypothetical protein